MRIAFFAALPFHAPLLEPVRAALGDRAATVLAGDRRAVVAFRPHVVVMATSAHLEYFRRALPGAFVVNVRHGVNAKRGLYRLPRRASARRFDAVCIGDELKARHYERAGASPGAFWPTGYPPVDPLFRGDPAPCLPLEPDRPTVLYAPTWNLGLTSATMLGDRLVELVRARAPDVNLVIKPHPVIGDWRPRWMERWARLEARHPRVHLVRDTHAAVTPYLLASQVLVSDASSVVFEFAALDRPIILITNPRRAGDPAWAPDDIVWRWRDVGHEIHSADELPEAVAMALADPAARRERRRAVTRILFGQFADGRSAERVALRLLEAGARVVRGEHPPAARPPLAVSLWHDVRTLLREHAVVRRIALGPLEALRLTVREWRQAAPAPPPVLEPER
jgi:hypothetical protein